MRRLTSVAAGFVQLVCNFPSELFALGTEVDGIVKRSFQAVCDSGLGISADSVVATVTVPSSKQLIEVSRACRPAFLHVFVGYVCTFGSVYLVCVLSGIIGRSCKDPDVDEDSSPSCTINIHAPAE